MNKKTSDNQNQNLTKIYLEDCPLEKIDKQMMNKLEPYYQKTNTRESLFSPEGVFILKKNKIIKQIPQDKPIEKKKYILNDKSVVLLIDYSSIQEQEVLSQIPYDHVRDHITEFYYSITPNNSTRKTSFSLYLVVEGKYESPSKFIPTDFYFLTNEKVDNYLIQKEFNVFLSMFI